MDPSIVAIVAIIGSIIIMGLFMWHGHRQFSLGRELGERDSDADHAEAMLTIERDQAKAMLETRNTVRENRKAIHANPSSATAGVFGNGSEETTPQPDAHPPS